MVNFEKQIKPDVVAELTVTTDTTDEKVVDGTRYACYPPSIACDLYEEELMKFNDGEKTYKNAPMKEGFIDPFDNDEYFPF